ncbi:MAG: cupin domain-containing protein [Rhodospirillaceae bacterium]|nr:cupin domain-containing protein [Rhodospirillaceae bacterium]MDE0704253.1 cupin domain-containing protein [Rhodospirillaceae bacterium]MXW93483.1 cupin domain-containing protein [Rhodospirillaceae bacterium]MYB14254.1 cupin domain-containing protein [Rhodospirillaceae bacterium]MYG51593.1 cupin domain-containing protein [Rhodospirillaceae bacterium]
MTVQEKPREAAKQAAEADGEPGYGNARVITADEYFQRVRHGAVRGCKWDGDEMLGLLEELGKDPIRHAERRFVALVNEDHGDLAGAAPGIFIGIQLIHPGELVPNHRHNSVAIYHYLQGRGWTTVEGVRYPYKRGDTIVCPAWAYHEHHADPEHDEDTIMYVAQDMPEMAAKRTLFFEEPQGLENVRHMVQGTSKSWSATRDPDAE